MWEKISDFPLAAYLSVTGFIRDFKRDERGLSGTVVAVLLILIAVLAVVFIWTGLGKWLSELWSRITGSADGIKEIPV